MPEPITILSALASSWKLLGTLYEKYRAWNVRRKTSVEAKQLQARAEELMTSINRAILLGANSDDPTLRPLVDEFKALLKRDVTPRGSSQTNEWIAKSGRPPVKKVGAGTKPPAAKKVPAKKAAPAKTAAAKKPAAKTPAAKKAARKSAAAPGP
jgi:hypothetical protein